MRLPIVFSNGAEGLVIAWGTWPNPQGSAGGADLLLIASPRAFAPGQPIAGRVAIDAGEIAIEARSIDSKRRKDGLFEVRARTVNLRKEHRAELDRIAMAQGLLFPSLAAPSDAPAVAVDDARLTYRQLAARVNAYVSALGDATEPSMHICVWTHGCIETAIALVGNACAGRVSVPLNPAIGEGELAHVLASSGASLVVGADRELARRTPGLPFLAVPHTEGDPSVPARYTDHAPLLVLYTSGTTGPPKGAVLSAHNVASNLDALAEAWAWTDRDTVVHALPLFHVHGLCLGLFGSLRRGGALSWLPKFDPRALAARVREEARDRHAVVFAVPTMFHRIGEAAENDPEIGQNLSAARVLISGSAPLSAREHARIARVTGQSIVERYGLTETLIVTAARHDGPRAAGSVGTPLAGVEVRLVDDARKPIASGDPSAIGEVAVRGPNVFRGYLNQDDATRAVRDRDGWFYTGDIASWDEGGALRIVGRRSTDLIKTGGFKVGAGEVEAAVSSHPAVRECAVVGRPDDDLGERIVVFIVAHEGMDAPNLDALSAHVATQLAPHKRPRALHVVPALPRNAMGKVQKGKLAVSFRFDPFTETWIAIAAHRRGLGAPFPSAPMNGPDDCPFCPGHEAETEETVLAVPEEGPWQVRVVRNRFPIVDPSQRREEFHPRTLSGPPIEVDGFGIHEVLIESRNHDLDLPAFDLAGMTRIVGALRDRARALSRIADIAHVAMFRNKGRRAGSSQGHPHAQIVALPFVPSDVARRASIALTHAARHGTSLERALVDRERTDALRMVDDDAFVIVCPFASHRAFETWIVPTSDIPFTELDDSALVELANSVLRAARALSKAMSLTDYNVVFRLGPCGDPRVGWHIEILPRTGGPAGFELSTGVDIATVAPERAAALLRENLPTDRDQNASTMRV